MTIELDSVELNFETRRVLNGVYLKIETGTIVGLLGRNGSGKSCLLQILFGSLRPKYKFIRINGLPLLQPFYKKGNMVYLPQHDMAPGKLKIKTLFKLLHLEWQDFISYFENFSQFYNYKLNTISGGERRVIETYAVLKMQSDVVLLDEPFSNIAPLYVEKIKELIVAEKTTKAILLTDHYYKDVTAICDALYLIHNGSTRKIESKTELEDFKYLHPDGN